MTTFINGEDISHQIAVNGIFVQGNSIFYIVRTRSGLLRILLYKDRFVYGLTVTQREDILECFINLEDSVRGNMRGLLGNFNGDSTDDFIMPNGIQVPVNASDQMLHDFGQSCEFWPL